MFLYGTTRLARTKNRGCLGVARVSLSSRWYHLTHFFSLYSRTLADKDHLLAASFRHDSRLTKPAHSLFCHVFFVRHFSPVTRITLTFSYVSNTLKSWIFLELNATIVSWKVPDRFAMVIKLRVKARKIFILQLVYKVSFYQTDGQC